MAWFADLAGKAESLLNNLDEQTGVALRNHNVLKPKQNVKSEIASSDTVWNQKKRPTQRNLKRTSATETRSNYTPRKPSPTFLQSHSQSKESKEGIHEQSPKKKSPVRKSPQYNLNHCPRTMVGDLKDNDIVIDHFGLKQRRYSLPADLELINAESFTYKMQNLEVENAMLKNELNVMNREVSELLDRLRRTEDELSKNHTQLHKSELENQRIILESHSLSSQLEKLKQKVNELTTVEIVKHKERNQSLEMEVSLIRDRNNELEEKIKELNEKVQEKDAAHLKLESELRHAQSVINDLQNDLERSNSECQRLEKDWETYKLRVKSMLFAKDNEIKSLQEGINLTEDTKILIEQLENLKDEREELSEAVIRVKSECDSMKQHIEQLESRHSAAERVVTALREALRDERGARNRAEAQYIALGKELKNLQIETGQTIASLRTALRDKENELNCLRQTSSTSVHTIDTSALNVADYGVMQDTIDNDKIHYLTETLVQKQGKIDSLMADNNILRIQLDKLQSKYKAEISSMKAHNAHSVVQFQDGDSRNRPRNVSPSALSKFSLRIGLVMRRYPIFRVFIIVYMIGLHFWVLTVLLTSTPENLIVRHTKS